MNSRIFILAGLAAAALALGLTGCGGGGDDSQTQTAAEPTHEAGAPETETGCTPAVMVVRHAEDIDNPKGGPDILSDVGLNHARLYPTLFRDYVAKPHSIGLDGADESVCPIGKVIAIDKFSNDENKYPGANPFDTIEPTAKDIWTEPQKQDPPEPQMQDPDGVSYSTVYNWNTPERLKTLLENGLSTPTSTVIAWDKQGLNPSDEELGTDTIKSKKYPNGAPLKAYRYTPLLQALPANPTAIVGSGSYTPQRTQLWVFTHQDPATGKFAVAKAYQQLFSKDGGPWSPTPAADSTDIKVVKP